MHMAIATDGWNVMGWHNFLVLKLEAKIVSLVSVHSHAHHFTIQLQICTVWDTKLRKHFNAIVEVFSVSLFRSACLVMHQTTMKTKGWQLQHAYKARWLLSEATVRAVRRFWLFGPHWSSCQEIKMMQCVLFHVTYKDKKFQHGAFLLSTLAPHQQNWTVFQAGCFDFEVCTGESFDRTVHQ